MPRPPEPGSFEHLVTRVQQPLAGLVRLSVGPAREPYWSRAGRYRFDAPWTCAAPVRFGVLYLAQDLATAFCESVIHADTLFRDGSFEVSNAELARRVPIHFRRADGGDFLSLADLTGAALKRMGLNNDISATVDYSLTQRWAQAIHTLDAGIDGIRYISRQSNRAFCVAVFDRCALVPVSRKRMSARQLSALCRALNVIGL